MDGLVSWWPAVSGGAPFVSPAPALPSEEDRALG